MIYRSDIPRLPSSVLLREDSLFDQAFGQSYPVNETGRVLLGFVDGKRSILDIAHMTALELKAPSDIVESDAVQFFAGLNRAFLVNIRKTAVWPRIAQWLWLVLSDRRLLARLGWQHMERREIPHGASLISVARLVATEVSLALVWWLAPLSAVLFLQGWRGSPVLAMIFVGSVALHEFGHVLALWMTGNRDNAAFIGRHLLTIAVYRRKLRPSSELLVAICGPLAPAIVGGVILTVGRYAQDIELQLVGMLLLTHLITLVPLAQDGRNALRAVRNLIGGM